MSKQSVTFKPRGYNFGAYKFIPATATTLETILTAGANDTLVRGILITSDDSSDRVVHLYIYDGTNSFLIDTRAVPASSGDDGTVVVVDGLAAAGHVLDNPTLKKVLLLKAGYVLKAAMAVTVTSAKTVTVAAFGEDF